jgi:predicted amidohydrolase
MKIALFQMTAGEDVAKNLDTAQKAVVLCAGQFGARLVCLPEYFMYCGPERKWKRIAQEETPKVVESMSKLAKVLGVYIALGSVLEDVPRTKKCANTSIVLNPKGREIARYRKRHLFDVTLPDARHRESKYLVAGTKPVVCKIDDWKVGLSVCFDLRFADHYAELRRMGADLFLVPSCFSSFTGRSHWDALLRTRAIENQCYVAAANQCGRVTADKMCHGHSMIIDPWGTVRAEAQDTQLAISEGIEHQEVRKVRKMIPMSLPRK